MGSRGGNDCVLKVNPFEEVPLGSDLPVNSPVVTHQAVKAGMYATTVGIINSAIHAIHHVPKGVGSL